MEINKLVRPNILSLKPYSSARDEYTGSALINLDANENPFENGLNRYPDPYQQDLKSQIADWKGVSAKNLILGNGSDEIIDLVMRAFGEPGEDEVLSVKPSYGMYKVSAAINNLEYSEVPLNKDFTLNVETVKNSINPKTKLIFLCSPNNPSGNTFSSEDIEDILTSFKGVVVVDEAYIDFSDQQSWIKRLNDYNQLIVLQTFSKSFGLAGIRLGMGWASEEIIEILNKIKPPYNVNQLTQLSALKELENLQKYEKTVSQILELKTKLKTDLEQLDIVDYIFPSEANFYLVKVRDANKVYDYLISKGIVVRNRTNQYNCQNCIRVSVGTAQENESLIKALIDYRS